MKYTFFSILRNKISEKYTHESLHIQYKAFSLVSFMIMSALALISALTLHFINKNIYPNAIQAFLPYLITAILTITLTYLGRYSFGIRFFMISMLLGNILRNIFAVESVPLQIHDNAVRLMIFTLIICIFEKKIIYILGTYFLCIMILITYYHVNTHTPVTINILFKWLFLYTIIVALGYTLRALGDKIISELEIHKNHLNTLVEEKTEELIKSQEEALFLARKAGQADIAISNIHTIGNTLNTLSVICTEIYENTHNSAILHIKKANDLIKKHSDNLKEFIINDPRAIQLLQYFLELEKLVDKEQNENLHLVKKAKLRIDTIRNVIKSQEEYIIHKETVELIDLTQIVDMIISKNTQSLNEYIQVQKNYKQIPQIPLQKLTITDTLESIYIYNIKSIKNTTTTSTITVTVYHNDDHIFFKICNSGLSLSDKELSVIFSQKYNLEVNNFSVDLHHNANSIQSMGGAIEAYRNNQKETVIRVSFPLVKSTN